MNNTDNAARTGATVYLNGTRIDCSHKGRPSVTGAIRVESILNSHAALVEALLSCRSAMLTRDPFDIAQADKQARAALAKGGQQ